MGRKRRKSRRKKINPTLFVFCEGETEEAYINLLKSFYRLPSIIIRPKISGSNITRDFIDKYKTGMSTHEKDIDFLMYDLDVPNVFSRLKKITNCVLLLSNPCIELWFLLHYKNQTSSVDCAYCCKEIKNRNRTSYKKGKIGTKLKDKLLTKKEDAIKRAKILVKYPNTGSTVYKFLEKLEELKN